MKENELNKIPLVTDINSIRRNGIIITTVTTNELLIKEYHCNTIETIKSIKLPTKSIQIHLASDYREEFKKERRK